MTGAPSPGVYVGPHHLPELERAVTEGGGRIVPLAEAVGVVYHGSDEPGEIVGLIHPGVRWVQLPHAGVERWTAAGLVTGHPVWTSATGAYAPQVAEHALALLLMAARGLHTLARADHWLPRTTRQFAGCTVALVGAGGIARSLVAMLEPFGCTVLAVSDSGELPGARRTVRRSDDRDVLGEAAYVVLSAPSTPQTRGMIGARELALLRPDAWLVNVARGTWW